MCSGEVHQANWCPDIGQITWCLPERTGTIDPSSWCVCERVSVRERQCEWVSMSVLTVHVLAIHTNKRWNIKYFLCIKIGLAVVYNVPPLGNICGRWSGGHYIHCRGRYETGTTPTHGTIYQTTIILYCLIVIGFEQPTINLCWLWFCQCWECIQS